MALTVATVEFQLLMRLGATIARVADGSGVDLDSTTADGTNATLAGPIREAALSLGVTLSDDATVTDADLAGVTGYAGVKLLDVAELKTLEICWGNFPHVDQQAGDEKQSLSQLADRIERRIKVLSERVAVWLGATATAGPGAMATGLIAKGRCTVYTPPPRWAYPSEGY